MGKFLQYFEKAARMQRQVGSPHPNNPNILWTDLGNGKFDWKSKNGKWWKGKNVPGDEGGSERKGKPEEEKDITKMSGEQLANAAKTADDETLKNIIAHQDAPEAAKKAAQEELKKRGGGNDDEDGGSKDASADDNDSKPKPTKTDNKKSVGKKNNGFYQTKKPAVDIVIDKPWWQSAGNGKQMKNNYEDLFALYETYDDKKILAILNNTDSDERRRHIAWEIAQEREIPESRIVVRGTLQKFWDREKRKNEPEEEEEIDFDMAQTRNITYMFPDNFNPDELMGEFEEGDDSYLNPNDRRILSQFGGASKKIDTPQKRRWHDSFIDYVKRSQPNYKSATDQVKEIGIVLSDFLDADNESPIAIAAGAAGAGKTTSIDYALDEHNFFSYDPEEAEDDPDNYKYHAIFAPQGVDSVPKLSKVLSANKDKIIIFDDNDDILTDSKMYNVMKTVCDNSASKRYFRKYKGDQPTGESERFTGKIIVLTNKSLPDLYSKNEDLRAVMDRVDEKIEVNLTLEEKLDIIKERYKTMPTGKNIAKANISKDEDEHIREMTWDWMEENREKLDPQTFGIRKFRSAYAVLYNQFKAVRRRGGDINDLQIDKPLRIKLLDSVRKAKENDLGEVHQYDTIEKGLFDDMTLTEAENLLLG